MGRCAFVRGSLQAIQSKIEEEEATARGEMNKHFSIKCVITVTDAIYEGAKQQLVHFTEVTVRFEEGFDWKKDDDLNALCKKLRAAAELNSES